MYWLKYNWKKTITSNISTKYKSQVLVFKQLFSHLQYWQYTNSNIQANILSEVLDKKLLNITVCNFRIYKSKFEKRFYLLKVFYGYFKDRSHITSSILIQFSPPPILYFIIQYMWMITNIHCKFNLVSFNNLSLQV